MLNISLRDQVIRWNYYIEIQLQFLNHHENEL